ncbi:hypothetical protein ATER59S_01855 [Aquamicrobium terrae]
MRHDDFSHLDPAARAAAEIARHPRAAVIVAVTAAVILSWAMLAAMAIGTVETQPPGAGAPGDTLLRQLPALPLPDLLRGFVALCLTPTPLQGLAGTAVQASVLVAMWFLMAVATMLPSAAPMIRTYCEIADTARRKGEAAVHPLVLVAGYLAVWLAASIGFAGLTLALHAMAPGQATLGPAAGLAGAAALFVAGAYQFTGLKHACLTKCRNPFSVLFGRWSSRPAHILRLGAEQGLWCLGCCWALMLVMFSVGIMNLFWMALIGLFSLVEKQLAGRFATWTAGAILLVWAAMLLIVSL